MYQHVIELLRQRVETLIQDELIENMMLRGSQVPTDIPRASNDIDAIMQSVLASTSNSRSEYSNSMPADDRTVELEFKYNSRANGVHNSNAGKGKGKAH
jgi:hypothetical protein